MARRYGASPLHLVAHVAAFALAGWAILQLVDVRGRLNLLAWFAGAIVLHDLVLLPMYSSLDRVARRGASGPAINFLRVPAMLSALLLAVWFPTILDRNDGSFARVAGAPPDGQLARWLLVTGVTFAASGILFALRGRRAAERRPLGP